MSTKVIRINGDRFELAYVYMGKNKYRLSYITVNINFEEIEYTKLKESSTIIEIAYDMLCWLLENKEIYGIENEN